MAIRLRPTPEIKGEDAKRILEKTATVIVTSRVVALAKGAVATYKKHATQTKR